MSDKPTIVYCHGIWHGGSDAEHQCCAPDAARRSASILSWAFD
jgi:hypothetical protein